LELTGFGGKGRRDEMGELDGKVAIVTGSTRGLGRAIATRFGREGASVVIHGRSPEACAEVAASIPGAVGHSGDIGAPGFADQLVAAAVTAFGRLDIVVNNAGAAIDNFITGVTDERWDASLATNLSGPFAMLRAATRVMKEGGGGVVLNVISWAGERGNVGQVAYSASKAGLHAVTLSAAKELGKFGIRVNSLSPAVATDMTEVMDARLQKIAASRKPIRITGTADDVAEGALFLCSDRARFVTGDTLHVDGGLHLN
jgi:3-oxoacyl-[acyl-carrier protein] reductase